MVSFFPAVCRQFVPTPCNFSPRLLQVQCFLFGPGSHIGTARVILQMYGHQFWEGSDTNSRFSACHRGNLIVFIVYVSWRQIYFFHIKDVLRSIAASKIGLLVYRDGKSSELLLENVPASKDKNKLISFLSKAVKLKLHICCGCQQVLFVDYASNPRGGQR